MTRVYLFFLTCLLGNIVSFAQTNFSRYVDESSVPVFDINQHLDVKFEWTMGGKMQMHMNEALNYITEGNLDLALSNLDDAVKVDSVFWPAHYYRGVVLTRRRDLKEARKAFQHAARLNPKHPQSYVALGRLNERSGKYKEAKSFYEKAISTDPKFAPGHFGLATVELFTGELRRASRLYEHCIEVDSTYAEAYVVLSILKYRDGSRKKSNESIELLNTALKANPKYKHSYFWRGYFYVLRDEREKCLADWTTYLNSNPDNPFMLSMRGFLFIELNRFDEAFTDLRKAFSSREIDEEAFKGAQTLLDKTIDLQAATQYMLRNGYGLKEETFALVKKSYCLILAGRSSDAIQQLQKAEESERSATIFLLEGIAFENINNHLNALRAYNEALALDNDIFDAHKKRSIYRYEQKDWNGAYADLAQMIRLQPKSPVPYRLRGIIRGHQQDYPGAIADLTRYLEFDSTDLEVIQSRAVCRSEIGDYQGALNDVQVLFAQRPTAQLQEQMIRIKIQMGDTTGAFADLDHWTAALPLATVPYVIRAELWIGKKAFTQAKKELKKAYGTFNVQFYPEMDSEITLVKGCLRLSENKVNKAISLFSHALRLDPLNDRARYYRGKAYLQAGKKEKAIIDFEFLARKGRYDAKAILGSLSEK